MTNRKYSFFLALFLALIVFLCIYAGVMGISPKLLLGVSIISLNGIILMLFPILLPLLSLFYLPILQIGDLNLTVTDGIIILFSSTIIIRQILKNNFKIFGSTVIYLIAVAFLPLVFGFIGHLTTFGNLQDALTSSLLFAKRFSMYSLVLLLVPFTHKKHIPIITYVFVFCIVIASLSAIFPQLNKLILSPETIQNNGDRRVGLLFNPNVAGNYAIIFLNFSIALLIYGKNIIKYKTFFAYIGLFLSVGLLFVSGSRGAIFAVFASVLFWVWQNVKSKNLLYVFFALSLAIIGLIVVFPDLSIISRWTEFTGQGVEEANLAGRLDSQMIGLRIFLDYPIFGAGIDSIGRLSENYGVSITGADSQYVDTLVETGILGLMVLLYILFLLFRIGIRQKGVYGMALAVNVLALSISGFSAFTFYSPFLSIIIWYFTYLTLVQNSGELYED